MREYGPHVVASKITLGPLTGEELRDVAKSAKDTSAGLDGLLPRELAAMADCCPSAMSALARLLNLVEKQGRWPQDAVCGFVAFVPKDLADG
eukprot:12351321-Alexandrium_andersonii.AAC.1